MSSIAATTTTTTTDTISTKPPFSVCCQNVGPDGQCSYKNGATASEATPMIETMLTDSMNALYPTKVPFDVKDCNYISNLILRSMITSGRVYHNMQHVFDISQSMKDNPILILSALFHDIIYYSIDKTFQPEQAKALEGIIIQPTENGNGSQSLSDHHDLLILASDFQDPIVEKVVRLYGFEPGTPLPKLGTNEFLSAIIAVVVLEKWLTVSQLIQIATCIEATIPFRPTTTDDNKTPMDRLYDRLKLVCPEQTEDWLVDTVQMAATTANCDLCSFDSNDRDFFLDSSWKLIPEARPTLLKEDCPLMEYYEECFALEGRTKFLKSAVPRIFQSFRQSPTDEEMDAKRTKTHENLKVMSEYAQVRMLQFMILVDFIKIMGEDPALIPLRPLLRMALPAVPDRKTDYVSPFGLTKAEQGEVRSWLVNGRRACFPWDPAISSLGAYLYDRLGPETIAEAIEIGRNQQSGGDDLLKFLPKEVIIAIASSLGHVFPDRVDVLSQIPEKLGLMA